MLIYISEIPGGKGSETLALPAAMRQILIAEISYRIKNIKTQILEKVFYSLFQARLMQIRLLSLHIKYNNHISYP